MRAPFIVGGTLLLAIVAALVAAERIVGAPRRDLELLALFLTVSGVVSLALGALVIQFAGGRIGSMRLRLALASAVGLLVTVVNVVTVGGDVPERARSDPAAVAPGVFGGDLRWPSRTR